MTTSLKKPIVVLGIGELGSVFSRAFLKNNIPVYPITRSTNIDELARAIDPELVLICTGEADLQAALTSMPEPWKNRVALMQNELLPRDWQPHNLTEPTVISVWFEKKKGMDSKVLIASPAYGKHAQILVKSLRLIDIPAREVADEVALLIELVLKNLYILTTNIAGLGLKKGATVADLQQNHADLMREVAGEVLDLQGFLTKQKFNFEEFEAGLAAAFAGDPAHQCLGRSANSRLTRALESAQRFNLKTPALTRIQAQYGAQN